MLPSSLPSSLPVTQTRGTFRKENEKKRSKCNREKFKQYMEELNECMGFKKLSINKCLSTAVSLLKLSMFSERFPTQEQQVAPDVFYEVGNYLGLAFDENGRILHITPKVSEHPLPFNMCQVGSFLTQICFNTDEILRKVFRLNSHHMEMKLKYSKKNKQPTSMFFSGKVMLNTSSQIKMFIGYGCIPDKRDSIRDPFMFNTGFEVWINSNYDIIKSHSWLELLLEESVKHVKGGQISLFSLLHPDDLHIIEECEEQMKLQGYFKVSCRVYDGENYLWLTARGYPQNGNSGKRGYPQDGDSGKREYPQDGDSGKRGYPQNGDSGKRYAEVHVWPFAYEDYKTGDMYLVDVKKLWSKKQRRGKICKVREKYPGSDQGGLDNSSDEFGACIPRKRPRSDGESSCSESYESSPKRVAIQTCPDLSYSELLRPIPKRVSAFEARSGAFVPVAGNIPVMHGNPVTCNAVRVEPILSQAPYINMPSPDKGSSGIPSPEPDIREPSLSPIFKPTMTQNESRVEKSESYYHIERLVRMNAVFKELKETNPGLYDKIAGVLDSDGGSDNVLSFLPLILKLQEKDSLMEGI